MFKIITALSFVVVLALTYLFVGLQKASTELELCSERKQALELDLKKERARQTLAAQKIEQEKVKDNTCEESLRAIKKSLEIFNER